jgi:hypothetical protein
MYRLSLADSPTITILHRFLREVSREEPSPAYISVFEWMQFQRHAYKGHFGRDYKTRGAVDSSLSRQRE